MQVEPLKVEQLYSPCDPQSLGFDAATPSLAAGTSGDVDGLQERAREAVDFAVAVEHAGYNLFVLGEPGSGRSTLVQARLGEHTAGKPAPRDWCYVHNFEQEHKPNALSFPAGEGRLFRQRMLQLVEDLSTTIPAAFEGDEYRARRQAIEESLKHRQEAVLQSLRERAKKQDIALMPTPGGFVFAPLKNDEVLPPEEFHKLPAEQQRQIEERVTALQEALQQEMRQFPLWLKETGRQIKALDEAFTRGAVEPVIDALRQEYADHAEVSAYLDRLSEDVLQNAIAFRASEEATPPGMPGPRQALVRYQVNLLVDNDGGGVPVVCEDYPGYQALLGRVEHRAQFGALTTDFTLIKGGSLHRANGGYLLLDARRLLTEPFAWEGLKRCLRSGELRIESLEQRLSLISTASLEPEPIPLQVKVILIGERELYYLLARLDPEFPQLFRVSADVDDSMPRDGGNERGLARLCLDMVQQQGLLPPSVAALARLLEESSRLAGDKRRLAVNLGALRDLLVEADHFARAGRAMQVDATHLEQALRARQHRHGRIRERMLEQMVRGTVRLATSGEAIGQVNGLSVIDLGQVRFGRPSRISARVRPGSGRVIDIEREVELGGPLHSKGVLILAGLLGGRYGQSQRLYLSASLVFEQSYGGVDGDSASSAEFYALVSALAEVPLRQGLAVTGSVDQWGNVQAIGGVNEKIEGFFDLCEARGLDGSQGVLIPASNVEHLMLNESVRSAVEAGNFAIYGIEHVDQGLELLTGLPAASADARGNFPEGSIDARVAARLRQFAKLIKPADHDEAEPEGGEDAGSGDQRRER